MFLNLHYPGLLIFMRKEIAFSTRFNFSISFSLKSGVEQWRKSSTKTQGRKEEKRGIGAKEGDTSTTRPRYETSFDE